MIFFILIFLHRSIFFFLLIFLNKSIFKSFLVHLMKSPKCDIKILEMFHINHPRNLIILHRSLTCCLLALFRILIRSTEEKYLFQVRRLVCTKQSYKDIFNEIGSLTFTLTSSVLVLFQWVSVEWNWKVPNELLICLCYFPIIFLNIEKQWHGIQMETI